MDAGMTVESMKAEEKQISSMLETMVTAVVSVKAAQADTLLCVTLRLLFEN